MEQQQRKGFAAAQSTALQSLHGFDLRNYLLLRCPPEFISHYSLCALQFSHSSLYLSGSFQLAVTHKRHKRLEGQKVSSFGAE